MSAPASTAVPGPTSRRPLQVLLLLLASLAASAPGSAQPRSIDGFDPPAGWAAVTTHGGASRLQIVPAPGKNGGAMLLDFVFDGYMGGVMAEKKVDLTLPDDYVLSFDMKGEARVNNFEFRLVDSADNVWWFTKLNYDFPRSWTHFRLRPHHIPFAWGPAWGGQPRRVAKIQFSISVVEGGSGKVWLDNLALEPLALRAGPPPVPLLTASSTAPGAAPRTSADSAVLSGWRSAGDGEQWLRLDLGARRDVGGVVVEWDGADYATAFELRVAVDGGTWTTAHTVTAGAGRRNYLPVPDGEARFVELRFHRSARGRGYAVRAVRLKGPEFSFSANDMYRAIAAEAPRGRYPKYFVPRQCYWTVVGAGGDDREALVNELGAVETDRVGFSLEPFLFIGGKLVTWNDVTATPSLCESYLPVPTVLWDTPHGVRLAITAFAAGEAGKSALVVRYRVRNTSRAPARGSLFVAARPFQVNPPWQIFTIVGGHARVDSTSWDGRFLRVQEKTVVPLTRPAGAGVAGFDAGDITEWLAEGTLPPANAARDGLGCASAALRFPFDLPPGDSSEAVLAVPFHGGTEGFSAAADPAGASRAADRLQEETVRFWKGRLTSFDIRLPGAAREVVHALRTNLAVIAISADGPALQPASRCYERSWIRDGSMIAASLLQMGMAEEVRRYIDWYASYQFPDGMVPCIVDRRGAETIPEHDSHGQFLYMIAQYFRYTRDTAWLRQKYDGVVKTVRYLQGLRAQRKTPEFADGPPEKRVLYGLVPESISHEGYSSQPRHSYWDDFFVLRGLKDAAMIARTLGDTGRGGEFAAERDDMRAALNASLRLSMRMHGIDFIPGCAELGDVGGLSVTVAVTPLDEAGELPEPELSNSFDQFWNRDYLPRKNNTMEWWAYLPYEWRFVDAYVHLGQTARAYDLADGLMADRRPRAWNGWTESLWKDAEAPRNIGDMPHAWVGSDFIRATRSMFVYERERDEALVVGGGLRDAWLADTGGVSVKDLPTHYGRLSYTARLAGGKLVVDLAGRVMVPPGGIVVKSGRGARFRAVGGDAAPGAAGDEAVVRRLPAHVELTY